MRIHITGAGLAGCAVAAGLIDTNHEVTMYDAHKDYTGWAIATGKVFPPKSETPNAQRLWDGYDYYVRYRQLTEPIERLDWFGIHCHFCCFFSMM